MGYRTEHDEECKGCKKTIRKNELQYDSPVGRVCKDCYEKGLQPQPRVFDLKTVGLQDRHYNGQYLGGHSMFPEKKNIYLSLLPQEAVVEPMGLHIPYSEIIEVKNTSEDHTDLMNVLAFGVWGGILGPKKKEVHLCIVYNDGTQNQSPVFNVVDLEDAQWELYGRFAKAHSENKPISSAQREFLHEITREKEVIVKVRCPYCHQLYDETSNTCPHCGASM